MNIEKCVPIRSIKVHCRSKSENQPSVRCGSINNLFKCIAH